MTPDEAMQRIDDLASHLWMVRTFLKHSEEAEDDDELQSVHRDLYDFQLALGPAVAAGDAAQFLKQARKKWSKLRRANELFQEIQPEISTHLNFQMAARSLNLAVKEVGEVLDAMQASS